MALVDRAESALGHLSFVLYHTLGRGVSQHIERGEGRHSPPVELSPPIKGGNGTNFEGSAANLAPTSSSVQVVQWSSKHNTVESVVVTKTFEEPIPATRIASDNRTVVKCNSQDEGGKKDGDDQDASAQKDSAQATPPSSPAAGDIPTVLIHSPSPEKEAATPSASAAHTASPLASSAAAAQPEASAAEAQQSDSAEGKEKDQTARQPFANRRASVFTRLRRTQQAAAANPFQEYAHLSGEGFGDHEVCRRNVFCPFSKTPKKPLDLVVVNTATVKDTIGLICYKYTEAGFEPELKHPASSYALRIAEDDFTPDMDLPPLELEQPVSRFSFDSLCLCLNDDDDDEEEEEEEDEEQEQSAFVRVWFPDGSSSILTVDTQVLMESVLYAALKKMRHGHGVTQSIEDYVLLRLRDGEAEELPVGLSSPLSSLVDGSALEFVVRGRYSKAKPKTGEATSESIAMFFAPLSKGPWHYWVKTPGKPAATELFVSTEKVSVSIARTGKLISKTKNIHIDMDKMISATQPELGQNAKLFKLKYSDRGGEKDLILEAKTESEAAQISQLIQSLLESRSFADGSVWK